MDTDTSEPDDYALAALSSNAAHVSYTQVARLLTVLPKKDDRERKELLVHFAVQTRHAFARLLAIVRWLKHRARLLDDAVAVEAAAEDRADLLDRVPHALWDVRATMAGLAAPRPALEHAIDRLSSDDAHRRADAAAAAATPVAPPRPPAKRMRIAAAPSPQLPSELSDVTTQPATSSSPVRLAAAAKPPPHAAADMLPPSSSSAAISPPVSDRVALATRNCIRESLLLLGPLRVLTWHSPGVPRCVRVGVPPLWSADVCLDSSHPHSAVLVVHALQLQIRSHPDAAPVLSPLVSDSQLAFLRRLANNRMPAALNAARTAAKSPAPLNATAVMLCALRDMMAEDVCAPFAMSVLRAQAAALLAQRWDTHVVVEGCDANAARSVPLVITYWQANSSPASIRFAEVAPALPADPLLASSPAVDDSPSKPPVPSVTTERRASCVAITHDPPLPTTAELGNAFSSSGLCMHALNLEYLLLETIRLRSRARLYFLKEYFMARRAALRVHPSCIELAQSSRKRTATVLESEPAPPPEDVLRVHFSMTDLSGFEVRVFALNGGTRVRPYGAAALLLPQQRSKDAGGSWQDARQYKTSQEEADAVVAAFKTVRAHVKLNALARSVCALDIGVSSTLPPGTASVAATASPERAASQLVPPFAPLERKAPRRFLTLSPPPPAKDLLASLRSSRQISSYSPNRLASSRSSDRNGPAKRPRLTYATTSDALVFIQESSFAGEDWHVGDRPPSAARPVNSQGRIPHPSDADVVDRYSGTAAAAAAWAVTREVVARRLRRDSLLRAFVGYNVASAVQMPHSRSNEGSDLHLDSASRVLLKVKSEPLPVRRAELLLRGYDEWQVRLSLLPAIFDNTESLPTADGEKDVCGTMWSVGVACKGSQLTFTYPLANTETVKSFFRDLTRARTAAALARGVPPSPFYRVLRRSPVRIVVGIGPYSTDAQIDEHPGDQTVSLHNPDPKPLYSATVEYVYSKGSSGGFRLSFSPLRQTMEQLAPLIQEALDASGGQVGSILAGLLERACPVAAATESAVRNQELEKIKFVTALRIRAVFGGTPTGSAKQATSMAAALNGNGNAQAQTDPNRVVGPVMHAVDVDARRGRGLVTVIDVGRATSVMVQQGLAPRNGHGGAGLQRRTDYVNLPKWDEIIAMLVRDGLAEPQRAGSTVVVCTEVLEKFLKDLVAAAAAPDKP